MPIVSRSLPAHVQWGAQARHRIWGHNIVTQSSANESEKGDNHKLLLNMVDLILNFMFIKKCSFGALSQS